MRISQAPKAGWGILEPDPELTLETIAILELLDGMPKGQMDALLVRAAHRYLCVTMGLPEGQEPTASDMVECTGALSNMMLDILGKPS